MESALHKNITSIYWMSFFQSAMIVTAVFVPLLQRHGLSMSEVLQTQALFAFVIATLEVPSGYLADLWGRRNTLVLGQALCGASFLQFLFADSFADFLLYEALIGAGMSLCSGADLALLYDSQSALNERGEGTPFNPGRHIARLVAIESYGGAASAVAAALLSLASLDWVVWAQCLVGGAAFFFSLRLVEAPRRLSVGGHVENLRKVGAALLARPLVLWTAAAIMVLGLASLLAFWLSQKYWELEGVPLTCFGWLWAVHCVLRALTAHYAHDIERRFGCRAVFLVSALLPIAGFLGMGLLGGVVGVLFGLAFPLCRGLSLVIFYDALNSRLDADFRATVNSLVSLGMRGMFILAGPAVGWLADTRGVHFGLLILAACFLPALALVLLSLARHVRLDLEARAKVPAPVAM